MRAFSISIYIQIPLYPQMSKFFIFTHSLFQGILGLPSRSRLTPSHLSIFLYFQCFLHDFKPKTRPHRIVFPSTRPLFYSFPGYRFLPIEDKRDCLGIHNLFKLAKFGLILVVSMLLSILHYIDNIHLFHPLFFVSHIFSTNPVPLHFFIIVCSSDGLQVLLLFSE